MSIPFDADIDMQGNKVGNPTFDPGAIAFASLATPAASFSFGNQKITSLATPTASTDAANKSYVDGLVNGTKWLAPVIVATTANITLSGEQTIDGVTTNASRILVKNQTTASQNGVYLTASGSWTRTTDLASGVDAANASMFIEQGTTYADTQWTCSTNTGSAVVGTNNLIFVQFGSGTGYSADGSTLQLSGTTFSIKTGGVGASQLGTVVDNATLDQSGTGSTLEIKAGGVGTTQLATNAVTTAKITDANVTTAKIADASVTDAKLASTFCKKFSQDIGDGSTTSIAVTHNLGTRDVQVEVYTKSGNYDTRQVVIQRTSINAVTLVYNAAPASNAHRVVVIG